MVSHPFARCPSCSFSFSPSWDADPYPLASTHNEPYRTPGADSRLICVLQATESAQFWSDMGAFRRQPTRIRLSRRAWWSHLGRRGRRCTRPNTAGLPRLRLGRPAATRWCAPAHGCASVGLRQQPVALTVPTLGIAATGRSSRRRCRRGRPGCSTGRWPRESRRGCGRRNSRTSGFPRRRGRRRP